MTQPRPLTHFASKATLVLLTLSVGVNILQANKIMTMDTSVPARVGTQAVLLEGTLLDGRHTRLQYEGRPTLLYWFSSTCRWCERNWLNVRAVANAASHRYRFVAATVEPRAAIERIASTVGVGVEFLTEVRHKGKDIMMLSGTPQLLVIGPDGVISHEWRGAFIDRTGRQIETLLNIALPGLSAPAGPGL